MSTWQDKERRDWIYSFQWLGKRYVKRGHKTRAIALDAQELKKRSLKFSRKQTPHGTALSLAVSHYLDYAERRFVPKTFQYKKMVLKKLIEHLGDREMEQVQPYHVQEFLLTRPSNHNFNICRKEVSSFWSYSMEKMRIAVSNPCKNVDRMPESQSVKYIPSQEDLIKLLLASGIHRPLLLVLVHSLARIDEILRMRWIDVNFQNRSLRLWTRKAMDGSWRHDDFPMNDGLFDVLKGLYNKRVQDEWVFYNQSTGTRFNRRPKIMKAICRRAGIKSFGFHSLRHFGASLLADSPKISKKTISDLLRHRSLATTEIYLHSVQESQREAVKVLDEFLVAGFGCGSEGKDGDLAQAVEKTPLK
jgi:integrase